MRRAIGCALYIAPAMCSSGYTLEDTLGSRGDATMKWLLPSAAIMLGDGSSDLAVVEAGAHRVRRLSVTGQPKATLTPTRSSFSSGPLRYPMGIASADPRSRSLVVADTHNHRLLRIATADGAALSNATHAQEHFGATPTPLRFPRGLAMAQHEWPPYGVRAARVNTAARVRVRVRVCVAPRPDGTYAATAREAECMRRPRRSPRALACAHATII